MTTWPAIATVLFFWLFNFVLFTSLGSRSKTHAGLILVAAASYWLLTRAGNKKANSRSSPEGMSVTQSSAGKETIQSERSTNLEGAMKRPRDALSQTTQVESTDNDDQIYARIAEELETGATDKGLWTRLFAQCGGDEKQTTVLYIKQRAERLIEAEQVRNREMVRERAAEAERLEKLRFEALALREKLVPENITKELTAEIAKLSATQDALALLNKVRLNRRAEVQALLDEKPLLVAVFNSDGDTALHIAVREKYAEMAHLLLKRGGRPDKKNQFNETPSEYAAKHGLVEFEKLLRGEP